MKFPFSLSFDNSFKRRYKRLSFYLLWNARPFFYASVTLRTTYGEISKLGMRFKLDFYSIERIKNLEIKVAQALRENTEKKT